MPDLTPARLAELRAIAEAYRDALNSDCTTSVQLTCAQDDYRDALRAIPVDAALALIAAAERVAKLEEALEILTTACELDFTPDHPLCVGDDGPVAASSDGDSAVTFAMIRAARAALAEAPR